jgi:type VI secretion system secreted protein Hcp
MAADTFAKIGDIQGESLDAKHKGEIEVQLWSWGVSQSAGIVPVPGGGAGAGKPAFQDFHFTHSVDKASPNLLKACATGQHIPDAIITIRKAGAGQQEYLIIKMTDVIVTAVQPSGPGGSSLVEQVGMQFAKVDLEYKPQKPDGSLDAGIHFTYDIRNNRAG